MLTLLRGVKKATLAQLSFDSWPFWCLSNYIYNLRGFNSTVGHPWQKMLSGQNSFLNHGDFGINWFVCSFGVTLAPLRCCHSCICKSALKQAFFERFSASITNSSWETLSFSKNSLSFPKKTEFWISCLSFLCLRFFFACCMLCCCFAEFQCFRKRSSKLVSLDLSGKAKLSVASCLIIAGQFDA